MGRPVVASDHGGAREQIIAERTGFLFPSGDATALAGGLRKALSLALDARARLHDEAIARVRREFSKDFKDRKSVVLGTSVSVRIDLGGSRTLKKKDRHYVYVLLV